MSTLPSLEILEQRIAPALVIALDASNRLFTFSSFDPSDVSDPIPIEGLALGESIVGIDFRPSTGDLYGLATSGRLYVIGSSGSATLAATLAADATDTSASFTALSGTTFGVDFNPVVDRLRVVSEAEQNLRSNSETGATTTDLPLAYAGGVPADPSVVGSAYSNNFSGTTTTTLYGIDSDTDQLVIQNPPNNGTLTNVGPLGVDASALVGFDIQTTLNPDGSLANTGFAILNAAGEDTALYQIDLTTGAATSLGFVGGNLALRGLAIYSETAIVAPNGKSATFFDVDGDRVTVTVTKGTLSGANFTVLDAGDFGFGGQLATLNLTDAEFAKANVTINAQPAFGFGNGRVNVGYLNATGVDLGKVTVDGDLGQIDAGNATKTDGGLAGLLVQSLGLLGTTTQLDTAPSLVSTIQGRVGTISIATDIYEATLIVDADSTLAITSLSVGGTLIGGDDPETGSVLADGNITTVKVGRGLAGGEGDRSGSVRTTGAIANAQIGYILGNAGEESGTLSAGGALGAVKVRLDVSGGSGEDSGSIESATSIRSVVIGGDLTGGSAQHSGSIYTGGGITNAGAIGGVTVGGDVSGFGELTGIISDSTIGTVKISGDIINSYIIAEGILGATTQKAALAIKSVTVSGSAFFSSIIAGTGVTGVATNADVEIGAVLVKGNWVGSNLSAGISDTNGNGFGFDDDDVLTNNGGNAAIIARIASVTIGGAILGTVSDDNDQYGFVAQQIVKFKTADATLPLESGPANDLEFLTRSFDVVLREYAPSGGQPA